MKKIIFLLLFFGTSLHGLACDCSKPSVQNAWEASDLVIEAIYKGSSSDGSLDYLEIKIAYKYFDEGYDGIYDIEYTVLTFESTCKDEDCGFCFKEGEYYLIYAKSLDEKLFKTDACSRSRIIYGYNFLLPKGETGKFDYEDDYLYELMETHADKVETKSLQLEKEKDMASLQEKIMWHEHEMRAKRDQMRYMVIFGIIAVIAVVVTVVLVVRKSS